MEYLMNGQGHLIGKADGVVVNVTRVIHFLADGRGPGALRAQVAALIPSNVLAEVAAQQNIPVDALVAQIMRQP